MAILVVNSHKGEIIGKSKCTILMSLELEDKDLLKRGVCIANRGDSWRIYEYNTDDITDDKVVEVGADEVHTWMFFFRRAMGLLNVWIKKTKEKE